LRDSRLKQMPLLVKLRCFLSPNSREKESVIGAGWPRRGCPTCSRVMCPLSLAGHPEPRRALTITTARYFFNEKKTTRRLSACCVNMTRALEWNMQTKALWMVLRMQYGVTGRGQLGMTAAHGDTRHTGGERRN
jgi:hypothetical protein